MNNTGTEHLGAGFRFNIIEELNMVLGFGIIDI
jgi:hypothetical protein